MRKVVKKSKRTEKQYTQFRKNLKKFSTKYKKITKKAKIVKDGIKLWLVDGDTTYFFAPGYEDYLRYVFQSKI